MSARTSGNEEQARGEYGIVIEPATIRFERVLPRPIERVWAYLTDSEKRGKWFASGQMELREGGRVELLFRHADLSPRKEPTPDRFKRYEHGHTSHGRIIRCEPPRLLSFMWGEEVGDDSEVTFELSPRGGDVLLILTHRRLVGRAKMLSVAGGWHTHLGILADHLNGREPRPFWSTHARIEAEYEKRLATPASERAMTDISGWLESTHREVRRAGSVRSVFLRRRFDASIEKVWSACAEREKLSRWFGDVDGELREGGVLAIDVGMKQKVTSRILRCERPNQLVVTWSYGGDPRDPVDQVELRLSSDGDGTVLELEHRSGDETGWNLGLGTGWEDWIIRLGVLLRGDDPAEVSSEELQPRLEPLWAALSESVISNEPGVKVSVSRRFSVSPERVFDACLDPEMIGKWMFGTAVREEETLRIAVDARVGGSFSFLVRRQGQEIDHIGKYREITRPQRLVFTWGIAGESDDESVVIIEIVPLEAGAELTLTHELNPKWADFAGRAKDAWAKMLDALVATLS
jgi:uncharacterized protein YndB with AHSA1/START domain